MGVQELAFLPVKSPEIGTIFLDFFSLITLSEGLVDFHGSVAKNMFVLPSRQGSTFFPSSLSSTELNA